MKRRINWKNVSVLIGTLATIVGMWVAIGLPTFHSKPAKRNVLKITHTMPTDETMLMEQRALINTGSGTSEITTRIPRGATKMIEVGE